MQLDTIEFDQAEADARLAEYQESLRHDRNAEDEQIAAGYLQEVELAGDGFLRLDVYPGKAVAASMSQLYRPASVYCITPTTEEIARKVAAESAPAPVARFELERAPTGHDPYDRGMAGL